MVENRPRGVPLSPKSMVDSVADWPLHRVVELLRKKEKEEKERDQDCRVFSRSSIRFLNTVIDEVASEFDVSRGRITRWLSYHGLEIFRVDKVISDLSKSYAQLRRQAVQTNDPDIASIIDAPIPYSPADSDDERTSYRVYMWVQADIEDLAKVCGAYSGRIVQMAMTRSILTADIPVLETVSSRLRTESERWDRWMKFRLGQLEMAVSIWGTL